MSAVYSTRFYVGDPTAPGADVYTVPAGMVAVARNLSLVVGASGATVALSDPVSLANVYRFTSTAANQYAFWSGDQVFPAGSVMHITVTTGSVYVYLSGFLLGAP